MDGPVTTGNRRLQRLAQRQAVASGGIAELQQQQQEPYPQTQDPWSITSLQPQQTYPQEPLQQPQQQQPFEQFQRAQHEPQLPQPTFALSRPQESRFPGQFSNGLPQPQEGYHPWGAAAVPDAMTMPRPYVAAGQPRGPSAIDYPPPVAGGTTLRQAAAAAFRAEQGAPYPALPPPAPATVSAAESQAAHHRDGGGGSAAVYEESIATGAFRRISPAIVKTWAKPGGGAHSRGDTSGGTASDGGGPSQTEDAERLEPSSFISPHLPPLVRNCHRSAQALLVGLLFCLEALVSQYADDRALLGAWAMHANWSRIAIFVLGTLAWLGAVDRLLAVRRATAAARAPARPSQQRTPPPPPARHTLASARHVLVASISYSLLLATVFATMPSDQRITVAATSLSAGASPSSQLASDIATWKSLLALRVVCAVIGWLAVSWDVRGPQELDTLELQQRRLGGAEAPFAAPGIAAAAPAATTTTY